MSRILAGYIAKRLNYATDSAALPYLIPRECVLRVSKETGYEPDVIVLEKSALAAEPLWEKSSTVASGVAVKLAVEVVSTNWQDDYELKLAADESMQIPEYWIVDCAGLGGVRHIGRPKRLTLTVCTLIEGEYEVTRLRDQEQIVSTAFPELTLMAETFLSHTSA